MAAISSGVDRSAVSLITETRYCIPIISCGPGRPSWAAAQPSYEHLRPDQTPYPGFLSTFWCAAVPWSGGPVEGCALGRAGLSDPGGPAEHVRDAHRDDRADYGPDQVDPPGGQVGDSDVGSEAAGGVHR